MLKIKADNGKVTLTAKAHTQEQALADICSVIKALYNGYGEDKEAFKGALIEILNKPDSVVWKEGDA